MKIDNSNVSLPFVPNRDGKALSSTAKPDGNMPPAATAGGNGNVGTTFTRLHNTGSTESAPIDASKLAKIKQAISDGSIQINSSAVAESLVKSVIELVATQSA